MYVCVRGDEMTSLGIGFGAVAKIVDCEYPFHEAWSWRDLLLPLLNGGERNISYR